MDSPEDVAWLTQQGIFWEAAIKDTEARGISTKAYVQDVHRRLHRLCRSDKMHGHEVFYRFLRHACASSPPGKLRLVLGQLSDYMPLVLDDFASKMNKEGRYMVLVDGAHPMVEQHPSEGILESCKKYYKLLDVTKELFGGKCFERHF